MGEENSKHKENLITSNYNRAMRMGDNANEIDKKTEL